LTFVDLTVSKSIFDKIRLHQSEAKVSYRLIGSVRQFQNHSIKSLFFDIIMYILLDGSIILSVQESVTRILFLKYLSACILTIIIVKTRGTLMTITLTRKPGRQNQCCMNKDNADLQCTSDK